MAEPSGDSFGWAAIGGAIVAVIAGAVAGTVKLVSVISKKRISESKVDVELTDRRDAAAVKRRKNIAREYRAVLQVFQSSMAFATKQHAEAIEQMSARHKRDIDDLRSQIIEIESQCRRNEANLEAKIDSLHKEREAMLVERASNLAAIQTMKRELDQMRIAGAQANIMDAMAIAKCPTDAEPYIVDANPPMTVLTHYAKDELVGMQVRDLVPPIYRQAHDDAMKAWMMRNDFPRKEPLYFYILTKDGSRVPVEINLSGWRGDNVWYISARIRGAAMDKHFDATDPKPVILQGTDSQE